MNQSYTRIFTAHPKGELTFATSANDLELFSGNSVSPVQDYSAAPESKKRILLVDDDADVRLLTRAFLEEEGYEVLSCSDGMRAIRTFREQGNIDLLLTDINMPQITGIEVADELSAVRPALPTIIASGALLGSDIFRRVEERGWRFLSKPFYVPSLLEMIAEMLNGAPCAGVAF